MSFALELARRVNSRSRDDLPNDVRAPAKTAITDTVGVAIAGASEPVAYKLGRALGSPPSEGICLVIGTPRRVSAEHAALINSVSAHALDFDDSSQISGAHPSSTLMPAALALAEEAQASGLDLLDAYVTGFEAMTRLGRAVMPVHYERGWHPTSTLGVFGAAAAAARMLRLDHQRFANALSIAVSLSSGVKSNFGTETKPLHAATACRNGVFAARLASEGLTASADAFEHKHGFFNVFHGAGACDLEAALADRPRNHEFRAPGIAIKQHPCCGSVHSIVDAALKLRARHGTLTNEAIAVIETSTHASRLAHTDRPDPRTDTDAKFSVQYVAARVLHEGSIQLRHFEDGAFRDSAVLDLMSKVTSLAHHQADPFLGILTVTLTNGNTLQERASTRFGRDADDPLPAVELYGKFQDCVTRSFPPEAARDLFDTLMALENVVSVQALTMRMQDEASRAARRTASCCR